MSPLPSTGDTQAPQIVIHEQSTADINTTRNNTQHIPLDYYASEHIPQPRAPIDYYVADRTYSSYTMSNQQPPQQGPPPSYPQGEQQSKEGYQQQHPQGPPPQGYPQHGYPQHPMPQGTPISALGPHPAPTVCPNCGHSGVTAVEYSSGGFTHALAGLFCFVTCLGCIPYFFSGLKDATHKCTACGVPLATYHRSGRTEPHLHG